MAKCSYCSKESPLTDEHVFPSTFYSNLNLDDSSYLSYNEATCKFEKKEKVVKKDVCVSCNGGELSRLDDNFKNSIFLEVISKLEYPHQQLQINFDYHCIECWLLKTSYNASRFINLDTQPYNKLLKYILGKKDNKNIPINIFSFSLNSSGEKSTYMSIGEFILESPSYNYGVRINKFIQIGNIGFIIVVYSSKNNYNNNYKDIDSYIYRTYGAKKISKDDDSILFNPITSKIYTEDFFHSNELSNFLRIITMYKVQWGNIQSCKHLKKPSDEYRTQKNFLLRLKYKNNKHIVILTVKSGTIEYAKYMKRCTIKNIQETEKLNKSSAIISRNNNKTQILIQDENNIEKPYVETDISQDDISWSAIILAIESGKYIYLAEVDNYCSFHYRFNNHKFSDINIFAKVGVSKINK